MPVEFVLDHFLQGVQQPGVGPDGGTTEVRGSDRHGNSRGTGDRTERVRRAVPGTYGIVGYETVGYETVG
jgi:hypothetical protein